LGPVQRCFVLVPEAQVQVQVLVLALAQYLRAHSYKL
jgi:hypothetical protein